MLKLYYEIDHETSTVYLLLFTSHNAPLRILHLKQFLHSIQSHWIAHWITQPRLWSYNNC